jgi:hypothetical protein
MVRAEVHSGDGLGTRRWGVLRARGRAIRAGVTLKSGCADNKVCRTARDFFSCFDVAGRYSATSNNCTNGLIRNNKDKAAVRNKFWGAVRA